MVALIYFKQYLVLLISSDLANTLILTPNTYLSVLLQSMSHLNHF